MAELKQEEFGASTQFKELTSQQKPSSKEAFDQFGDALATGTKVALELGQAGADKDAREAAADFLEIDLDLEQVNDRRDLFVDKVEEFVAIEESNTGAFVSKERLAEVRNKVMNRVKLGQRSIQAAIEQGAMSQEEGEARARIMVQREVNKVDGVFFKGDITEALADLTGAGSGSPAFTFKGTAADLAKQQLKQKEADLLVARESGILAIQQATDASREDSEITYDSRQKEAQRELYRTAQEKKRARSSANMIEDSAQRLNSSQLDLSVNLRPFLTGQQQLFPNFRNAFSDRARNVVADERSRLLSQKVDKDHLDAFDKRAKEYQENVDALLTQAEAGKMGDAQLKILDNLSKLQGIDAFPDVHRASLINEAFGTAVSKMNPTQLQRFLTLKGVDKDKWEEGVKALQAAARMFGPAPNQEPLTTQEKQLARDWLSTFPEEVQAEVLEGMREAGGSSEEYKRGFDRASPSSLVNNSGGTDSHVRKGDKAAAKHYIDQVNGAANNYDDFVTHVPSVDMPVEIILSSAGASPRGRGKPKESIRFHKDLPSEYKELIKRVYTSLKQSKSLWQDDFDSPEDAVEAVFNQGFRFNAEDFTLRMEQGKSFGRSKTVHKLEPRTPSASIPDAQRIEDADTAEFQGEFDKEQSAEAQAQVPKGDGGFKDFTTTPPSAGPFSNPDFQTWRVVYNTESQKTADDNRVEAQSASDLLNNPSDEQLANINEMLQISDSIGKTLYEHKFTGTRTWDEINSLLVNTIAAETSAGTNLNNTKSNAAGWMQIMPDTATSLIKNHQFSKDAAIATGFDTKAYLALTTPEQKKKMLAENREANIIFAIAKYFEQKRRL